jgi:hypothetical protein
MKTFVLSILLSVVPAFAGTGTMNGSLDQIHFEYTCSSYHFDTWGCPIAVYVSDEIGLTSSKRCFETASYFYGVTVDELAKKVIDSINTTCHRTDKVALIPFDSSVHDFDQ